MTQEESSKLVSKELLKKFGDKSKRIFKEDLNSEIYNSEFSIELTTPHTLFEDSELEFTITGQTSYDLNAKVFVNYKAESESFELYGIQYGPAIIDEFNIYKNSKSEFIFNVHLQEEFKYVKVHVVDVNSENINIGKVIEASNDLELLDTLTEFVSPFSASESAFTIVDRAGNAQAYPWIDHFDSILKAGTATQLQFPRNIKLSGLVEDSSKVFDGSQDIEFSLKMGHVDPDNYTQYNAVQIDNNTGAIQGVNIPDQNWVTTGYSSTDPYIVPLKKDVNNRGYIVLPKDNSQDIHHMDLTLVSPADYPGAISQHIGPTVPNFVEGYYYKSMARRYRSAKLNVDPKYSEANIRLAKDFDCDAFINQFLTDTHGQWSYGGRINLSEFPKTLRFQFNFAIVNGTKQLVNVIWFEVGTSNLVSLDPECFDRYGILYDPIIAQSFEDTICVDMPLTETVSENSWVRIDVQPMAGAESLTIIDIDNILNN